MSKYIGALSMATKVMGLTEQNKKERELDRECKEAEEAIARENELERTNEGYIQRHSGFVK